MFKPNLRYRFLYNGRTSLWHYTIVPEGANIDELMDRVKQEGPTFNTSFDGFEYELLEDKAKTVEVAKTV